LGFIQNNQELETYNLQVVEFVMRNKSKLYQLAQFSKNTEIIDTIVDVDTIMQKANLPQKQLEAIELHWLHGYGHLEISKFYNVSHQAIHQRIASAKHNIKKILDSWK
jgi:predicted RNA polymerase sigma factor